MAITFESFFKVENESKIKVKFNMKAGSQGSRAWDNLQDEEKNNEWYNMCAHRNEKGQASNNLEHYDYLLAFAQYYPYGPEY